MGDSGVSGLGTPGLLLFSLVADIDLDRRLGLSVLSAPWREHPCDWGVWQRPAWLSWGGPVGGEGGGAGEPSMRPPRSPSGADATAHTEATCLSSNSRMGPVFLGALEDI